MSKEKIKGKFISAQEMALLADAYTMIEGVTVSGMNNVKLMSMIMQNIQQVFGAMNERDVMEIDPPKDEEKKEG